MVVVLLNIVRKSFSILRIDGINGVYKVRIRIEIYSIDKYMITSIGDMFLYFKKQKKKTRG